MSEEDARKLKLVHEPASSSRVSHPSRRPKFTKFHSRHLLKLIREAVHGMFYKDEKGQMCFMRTNEIPIALTNHLFHLRCECTKVKFAESFHYLLSFDLDKRRNELLQDGYKWIKDEIIEETTVVKSMECQAFR